MPHLPLVGILAITSFVAGCAHPMTIRPDISSLSAPAETSRIPKNIGLYISPENRNQEVTTSGGGGDKVSYHPYADMEAGLYKTFGDTFQNVDMLNTLSDANSIAKHSLTLVAIPEISATSSSSAIFTWMATDFTVQLTCRISDVTGHLLTTVSSTGVGHAEFADLKSDFSAAGERAASDALQKLQTALLQTPELRR